MKEFSIQNIYDDPVFYSEYKKLRNNAQGFNNQLEQPAIRSLIPELKEKNILDIGCGFGDFCLYAVTEGANHIIGLDPSKNMISEAKKMSSHTNIMYLCQSIESAQFDENQFDLIVSSLAIHYVEDYLAMIKKISSWLKVGGYFVFSVEHPICTANPNSKLGKDEENLEFHPVYNYRDEKCFTQTWFVDGVKKYHRTLSTYLNTLLQNNFYIYSILEPMPTDDSLKLKNNFYIHKIRPPLLIIKSILNKKY